MAASWSTAIRSLRDYGRRIVTDDAVYRPYGRRGVYANAQVMNREDAMMELAL